MLRCVAKRVIVTDGRFAVVNFAVVYGDIRIDPAFCQFQEQQAPAAQGGYGIGTTALMPMALVMGMDCSSSLFSSSSSSAFCNISLLRFCRQYLQAFQHVQCLLQGIILSESDYGYLFGLRRLFIVSLTLVFV